MPTFTWVPDHNVTKSKDTRVNEVKFGDGYSQRVPEGINSTFETWDVAFTLRTKTEIDSIDSFLNGQKGAYSFDWTTPNGVSRKFVCKKWAASYTHDGDCSLTATFEQVFEA